MKQEEKINHAWLDSRSQTLHAMCAFVQTGCFTKATEFYRANYRTQDQAEKANMLEASSKSRQINAEFRPP